MPACGSARGGAGWRIEGSVSRADTPKQRNRRASAVARAKPAKSDPRNCRAARYLRNSVKTADGFPLNFVRRAPAIARAMFAAQRLTTMRPRKCAIGTRVAILCGMSGIRKTMEGVAMNRTMTLTADMIEYASRGFANQVHAYISRNGRRMGAVVEGADGQWRFQHRRVTFLWRALVLGWLVLTLLIILLAYWLGLK
jgi:hypothetical protein